MKTLMRLVGLSIIISGICLLAASRQLAAAQPSTGMIVRAFHWRHFNGQVFNCTVHFSLADLQAAQTEFGLPRNELKLTIPGVRFNGTYRTAEEKCWVEQEMAQQRRKCEAAAAQLRQQHEEQIYNSGLLHQGNALTPNYPRLYRRNLRRISSAARALQEIACANGYSDFETIALALSFVQEIKYQLPPGLRGGHYTCGVWTPLEVLTHHAGDCSSKSLLLATLLGQLTTRKVILIAGTHHMIVGIQGTTAEGPLTVDYQGVSYLPCEASAGVWIPGKVSPAIVHQLKSGKFHAIDLGQ